MSRHDPDRNPKHVPLVFERHHILLRHLQSLGGRRRKQQCIVPCQLCQRPGEFLKPAVVVVAAVEDIGIGTENDFERVCGNGGPLARCSGGGAHPSGSGRNVHGRWRGRVDNAVEQRTLPVLFEIAAGAAWCRRRDASGGCRRIGKSGRGVALPPFQKFRTMS